jgi:hypothetical protein
MIEKVSCGTTTILKMTSLLETYRNPSAPIMRLRSKVISGFGEPTPSGIFPVVYRGKQLPKDVYGYYDEQLTDKCLPQLGGGAA